MNWELYKNDSPEARRIRRVVGQVLDLQPRAMLEMLLREPISVEVEQMIQLILLLMRHCLLLLRHRHIHIRLLLLRLGYLQRGYLSRRHRLLQCRLFIRHRLLLHRTRQENEWSLPKGTTFVGEGDR